MALAKATQATSNIDLLSQEVGLSIMDVCAKMMEGSFATTLKELKDDALAERVANTFAQIQTGPTMPKIKSLCMKGVSPFLNEARAVVSKVFNKSTDVAINNLPRLKLHASFEIKEDVSVVFATLATLPGQKRVLDEAKFVWRWGHFAKAFAKLKLNMLSVTSRKEAVITKERKDMLIEFRSQHTMLKELLAVVYPEEGPRIFKSSLKSVASQLQGVPGVGLEVEMNIDSIWRSITDMFDDVTSMISQWVTDGNELCAVLDGMTSPGIELLKGKILSAEPEIVKVKESLICDTNYKPRCQGVSMLHDWGTLLKAVATDGHGELCKGQATSFKNWAECIRRCTEVNDMTYALYTIVERLPKIPNIVLRRQAAKAFKNEMAHSRKGFLFGDDLSKDLAALIDPTPEKSQAK